MKKGKVFLGLLVVLLFFVGCGKKISPLEKKVEGASQEPEVVLYFARHGKTMLNTVDRSQGWIDAPLTPAGVEVAEYLGKGLRDVSFDKVFSSDSGRALETAELILTNSGQKNVPIEQDKRLREYNFGTYEGMMNEEMLAAVAEKRGLTVEAYNQEREAEGFYLSSKRFADTLSELDKAKEQVNSNWLAEDSQTISKRLQASLTDIIEETQVEGGGNVLVVSHGMSIITLLGDLDATAELPVAGLKNASISKVSYREGKYKILAVNDLSYVENGQKLTEK